MAASYASVVAKDNGASPVLVKSIPELSPEVQNLIRMVQRFDHVNSYDSAKAAVRPFNENGVLDEVGIYIPGKERIRVLSMLISFFVQKDLVPKVARIQMLPNMQAKLEVDLTIHMRVQRHWWLPATYLVPNDLPADGTLTIIVNGTDDSLSLVKARVHNIPPLLPFPIRWALGRIGGDIALAFEPFVLAAFNKTEEVVESLSQMADPVIHSSAAESVKGAAAGVYQGLSGAVQAAAEAASSAAASAVTTVSEVLEGTLGGRNHA